MRSYHTWSIYEKKASYMYTKTECIWFSDICIQYFLQMFSYETARDAFCIV